ncbi:hypothetical protein ABZW18_28505 [Streptomyces sp. NPDC004647]|uniref:hypothetical protein n=1 Tax=Streptomyces sp. NPDC004647 TaxID=3154671 RepID=UPI0033B7A115
MDEDAELTEEQHDFSAAEEEPDVFLEVPLVKVDEIHLEVEDLRARVSLQAEVLDLLKLNVGADAALGRVELEIKGAEAQALLKVRLDNVAAILGRVFETIDDNPQILEQITRGVGSAVQEVGSGAGGAVGELGRGAGEVAEDVGGSVGEIGEDVGKQGDKKLRDAGRAAQKKRRREVPTAEGDSGGAKRTARKAVGSTPRKTSRKREESP